MGGSDGSGPGLVPASEAARRTAPVPPWLGNLAALSWRLLAIALLVVPVLGVIAVSWRTVLSVKAASRAPSGEEPEAEAGADVAPDSEAEPAVEAGPGAEPGPEAG